MTAESTSALLHRYQRVTDELAFHLDRPTRPDSVRQVVILLFEQYVILQEILALAPPLPPSQRS